jgi:magnesium-dependent phosphatase 1
MTALKLVVFDLDYTVWGTDMHEIFGPPKRVRKLTDATSTRENNHNNNISLDYIVTDQYNTQITIYDGAAYALSQINQLRQSCNVDIQVAAASKTDARDYAETCMGWLTAHDGKTLTACFDHMETGNRDKKWHFQRFQKKTGIEYESMVFFDNDMSNIQSIKQLGVKCFYTPDGMTREAWDDALKLFELDSERNTASEDQKM